MFVTKNEILTALNKPEHYILALVQVPRDQIISDDNALTGQEATTDYQDLEECAIRYIWQPFEATSDWSDIGSIKDWNKLWKRGRQLE